MASTVLPRTLWLQQKWFDQVAQLRSETSAGKMEDFYFVQDTRSARQQFGTTRGMITISDGMSDRETQQSSRVILKMKTNFNSFPRDDKPRVKKMIFFCFASTLGVNRWTHWAIRFLPRALRSTFDVTAGAKKLKIKKGLHGV